MPVSGTSGSTMNADVSHTSYGVSYTDREEEKPDPEKDRRFAGARFGWDYMERFNAGTTFDNKFETDAKIYPISPTIRSTRPAHSRSRWSATSR